MINGVACRNSCLFGVTGQGQQDKGQQDRVLVAESNHAYKQTAFNRLFASGK